MPRKISNKHFLLIAGSLVTGIGRFYVPITSLISKLAILSFFLPISIISAQYNDRGFRQVPINIDGEEINGSNAIVQDLEGYIWLSTNLGLLKYDGYSAKAYKNIPGDSTSLTNDKIESLYVDHLGDIWIGTAGGVCRYNADCDCFFQYQPTKHKNAPIGFVNNMIEDNNNDMWLIQTSGLFHYDRNKDSFTRFLDKPDDEIKVTDDVLRVILEDRNNNIWIGTGYGKPSAGTGLIRFNPKTGAVKRFLHNPKDPNSLLDNRVSALYEDSQGRLLIGTYKCGLHIYQPKTENFERLSYNVNEPNQLHAPYLDDMVWGNDPFVQIIQQDQNGGYWIGTIGKGLNYFDPTTGKRSFYSGDPEDSSLSINDKIWKFIEDRQGILWLGTLEGPVVRMDPYVRNFKLQPEFEGTQMAYESPLSPGTIWVGSNGNGLFKMDLATDKTTNFSPNKNDDKSLRHTWVRCIYQENQGNLWLGLGYGGQNGIGTGDGGLDLLDLKTGEFTHIKIEKEDGRDDFSYTVFNMVEDKEGYLWLCTGAGGLFRSNKDKTEFKHFAFQTPDSTLNDAKVFDAHIDNQGDLWVVNSLTVIPSDADINGSILYRYDVQNGKFIPQFTGFFITDMTEIVNGWKWFGTWTQGLLHYNTLDGTYKRYTMKDGLPSNEAIAIAGGENGKYWIGTRKGPVILDSQTGEISSVGLPKAPYNLGVLKGSDGRLYFNNKKGLLSFHPDHIGGNPFPPQVVISDFLVSGRSNNSLKADIKLTNDQNDISIEYVGLHFNNPSQNHYKYKLSNINEDWVDAGTERTARYANLPPNRYVFQVKAASNDEVWSEEAASISFIINPPWWQTWWAYLLFTLSTIAGVFGYIRYRSRALVKENKKLEESVAERTVTLEQKSNELEQSLVNLKATQKQLIQSEKLASLGELTAGIAHEIQNPLNFVNNFSELSGELIDEMNEEIENAMQAESGKEHLEEVKFIASDLQGNLSKILYHGKRAEAIVKGMLQHSKTSSGVKESTDINALTDEYLRLAYHGLRAKDKSFNATMNTDYDESIGKVSVIPQDMGRVFLNLITNAFYAVNAKKQEGREDYLPTVSITTKKLEKSIVISIKDNGKGIPDSIKEKIFQPFFTTKPTGEGTGLGLSLAHDIVVAHEGYLKVESEEGKWTEFKIELPI